MEDAKLQKLHDTLSKLRGHQGLGSQAVYSWQKKSGKTEPDVVDNGLPKNRLYRDFVKEGTYDPKQKTHDGDGRVIKRDFSDIQAETTKEERKRRKKEAAKAAKLELKRQAKLEEKKRLKRLQKSQSLPLDKPKDDGGLVKERELKSKSKLKKSQSLPIETAKPVEEEKQPIEEDTLSDRKEAKKKRKKDRDADNSQKKKKKVRKKEKTKQSTGESTAGV